MAIFAEVDLGSFVGSLPLAPDIEPQHRHDPLSGGVHLLRALACNDLRQNAPLRDLLVRKSPSGSGVMVTHSIGLRVPPAIWIACVRIGRSRTPTFCHIDDRFLIWVRLMEGGKRLAQHLCVVNQGYRDDFRGIRLDTIACAEFRVRKRPELFRTLGVDECHMVVLSVFQRYCSGERLQNLVNAGTRNVNTDYIYPLQSVGFSCGLTRGGVWRGNRRI